MIPKLNAHRASQYPDEDPIEDPTDGMIYIFAYLCSWYTVLRQPQLPLSSVYDLIQQTETLQKLLKEVFPNKAGKTKNEGFPGVKL